jgi:hypothetical protein
LFGADIEAYRATALTHRQRKFANMEAATAADIQQGLPGFD